MMKNYLAIAAFSLVASLVSAPQAAPQGTDFICLLAHGCYWDDNARVWVCPTPAAYVDCKVSDMGG